MDLNTLQKKFSSLLDYLNYLTIEINNGYTTHLAKLNGVTNTTVQDRKEWSQIVSKVQGTIKAIEASSNSISKLFSDLITAISVKDLLVTELERIKTQHKNIGVATSIGELNKSQSLVLKYNSKLTKLESHIVELNRLIGQINTLILNLKVDRICTFRNEELKCKFFDKNIMESSNIKVLEQAILAKLKPAEIINTSVQTELDKIQILAYNEFIKQADMDRVINQYNTNMEQFNMPNRLQPKILTQIPIIPQTVVHQNVIQQNVTPHQQLTQQEIAQKEQQEQRLAQHLAYQQQQLEQRLAEEQRQRIQQQAQKRQMEEGDENENLQELDGLVNDTAMRELSGGQKRRQTDNGPEPLQKKSNEFAILNKTIRDLWAYHKPMTFEQNMVPYLLSTTKKPDQVSYLSQEQIEKLDEYRSVKLPFFYELNNLIPFLIKPTSIRPNTAILVQNSYFKLSDSTVLTNISKIKVEIPTPNALVSPLKYFLGLYLKDNWTTYKTEYFFIDLDHANLEIYTEELEPVISAWIFLGDKTEYKYLFSARSIIIVKDKTNTMYYKIYGSSEEYLLHTVGDFILERLLVLASSANLYALEDNDMKAKQLYLLNILHRRTRTDLTFREITAYMFDLDNPIGIAKLFIDHVPKFLTELKETTDPLFTINISPDAIKSVNILAVFHSIRQQLLKIKEFKVLTWMQNYLFIYNLNISKGNLSELDHVTFYANTKLAFNMFTNVMITTDNIIQGTQGEIDVADGNIYMDQQYRILRND